MSVASGGMASRFGFLSRRSGHTAQSAALLLMASNLLSGVLGLVRTKYINHIFGAGAATGRAGGGGWRWRFQAEEEL